MRDPLTFCTLTNYFHLSIDTPKGVVIRHDVLLDSAQRNAFMYRFIEILSESA